MHAPLQPSGLTPYRIIGEVVRLRAKGVPPTSFKLEAAKTWREEDFHERRTTLIDLVAHLEQIGRPCVHPWRGVCAATVLVTDRDRLMAMLGRTIQCVERIISAMDLLGSLLGLTELKSALDA